MLMFNRSKNSPSNIYTSISARGVSADTESMQMMSTAPDLHIRSAADKEKVVSK